MGIGTVKGVEIGAGFAAARMTGTACNDPIGPEGFRTNHAGGILAGITNGGEIVLRVACKPIPSIAPAAGDDRRPRESRRHSGQRPSRRVGHPADHPGLRGDGLHRPRGPSPTAEGDRTMRGEFSSERFRYRHHRRDGGDREMVRRLLHRAGPHGPRVGKDGGDAPSRSSRRPAGSSSWPSRSRPRSTSSARWDRFFRKRPS